MDAFSSDPILPIVIVTIEGGKKKEPRREEPPDLRPWQIEEFLRQMGKGVKLSGAATHSTEFNTRPITPYC